LYIVLFVRSRDDVIQGDRLNKPRVRGRGRSKILRKPSKGPTAHSVADLQEQLDCRAHERDEALAQQAATVEVLRAISSSAGEVVPIFETILANALRLCDAQFGHMLLFDGEAFTIAAMQETPLGFANHLQREPKLWPYPGSYLAQLVETKKTICVRDFKASKPYAERVPRAVAAVELGGIRSQLFVPMLKETNLIGSINIYRQEVRPFTERQILLVESFAAQAVIAIENTRLLNELRESLEQQTATSDVLKAISRSISDLPGVLDTLLATACRLCEADIGTIRYEEDSGYRLAATFGCRPEWHEHFAGYSTKPDRTSVFGQTILKGGTVHIPDVLKDADYARPQAQKLMGLRAAIGVPLMRESRVFGVVNLFRSTPGPFAQQQIKLVETFADQAVVAIENARLVNELHQRTDDLSESLEQQTATSEVLKVISTSQGKLEPVFQAVLANTVRLCAAKFGTLWLAEGEGDLFRSAAVHDLPRALAEARRREPVVKFAPNTGVGRVVKTKQVVHVDDMSRDPAYLARNARAVTLVELGGARTVMFAPMFKDDEVIGVLTVYRQEVHPFTDKQIELVQNFAAQAVIAIENTRLLNELRQRTNELAQRQAELRVTFDNMGEGVVMFDQELRLAAWNRNLQEIMDIPDAFFAELRSYRDYVTYLIERGEFTAERAAELARFDERSIREERFERTRPNGRILEVRRNPVPGGGFVLIFSDITERKEAEERVRAARDAAERALAELRAAQDRLVQTEKLASLGQLTAGIAHEIKNPLNFVNNFSGVTAELINELQEALQDVSLNEKKQAEITDLTNTLRGNLDKIVQHGQRADAIVKNMLLHSRQGSAEHRPVEINALVEESLNLAWHGARAEQQGFNITLERSLDPAAGEADVFPQDITRVLLNLISNGFYAATRRKAQADGGDYEPILAASTKDLGDSVEIRIRDNGTGIPPEVKERMFNPFFTTKPAGEGTGLGLSISHDVIVKQHGGSIEVDTQPGEFTEIKVILPRAAASLPERS
jgi:two-component system NtrC family sensor kinase